MTESRLQREAEQTSYTLRSSFFYRVHSTWQNLLQMLTQVRQLSLNWTGLEKLGISKSAWRRVSAERVDPVSVFCHPNVIKARPPLIAYYRCLALLPQKGAQRLVYSTQRFEEGKKNVLTDKQATKLAQVFNGLISLLIDSDPTWSLEKSRIAALLNLGTQVNGSWRNEIGTEGGRRVKELLVSHFVQSKLITNAHSVNDSQINLGLLAGRADLVRSFLTTTGYEFIFVSEPDVSIRNTDDVLVSTVEIKYGLDPAGALERYGAAKKSFEEATKANRRVHNIYLASCITPEVRKRIKEDRLVNEDFNLTEILGDTDKRQDFLRRIEHLVSL